MDSPSSTRFPPSSPSSLAHLSSHWYGTYSSPTATVRLLLLTTHGAMAILSSGQLHALLHAITSILFRESVLSVQLSSYTTLIWRFVSVPRSEERRVGKAGRHEGS